MRRRHCRPTADRRAADFLDWTPGAWELVLAKADSLDSYTVTVTDSSILLAPNATDFTTATEDTVWRVPRSSMAIRCDTRIGADSLCTQLFAAVLEAVTLHEFQFPATGLAPYGRSTEYGGTRVTIRCFRYDEPDAFDRAVAAAVAWLAPREPYTDPWVMLIDWTNERRFPWLELPETPVAP